MLSNRARTRALALLAALFVVVLAGAGPKPEAVLPPDLDLLPRDAAFFLSVRVGELWKSETTGALRDLLAALPIDVVHELEVPQRSLALAGVSPIDRLRPCVDAARRLLSEVQLG